MRFSMIETDLNSIFVPEIAVGPLKEWIDEYGKFKAKSDREWAWFDRINYGRITVCRWTDSGVKLPKPDGTLVLVEGLRSFAPLFGPDNRPVDVELMEPTGESPEDFQKALRFMLDIELLRIEQPPLDFLPVVRLG